MKTLFHEFGHVSGGQFATSVSSCPFPGTKLTGVGAEWVLYMHHSAMPQVMHLMLAHTRLERFAGIAMENAFAEAPSQMLENW